MFRRCLDVRVGFRFVWTYLFRRSGSHGYRVQVFDLSANGCKVELIERPAIGERVWIKFDHLQAIEAEVRWVEGHTGGLELTVPCMTQSFGSS